MDAYFVNADFLLRLGGSDRVSPYAGLGIGLLHAGSRGEGLANAILGVEWKGAQWRVTPYVQARYFQGLTDSEINGVSLAVGFRF